MTYQENLIVKGIISTLLLFAINVFIVAQEFGTVKGKVTDAATGEILPAATVTVAGTSIGVITDLNGNYTLPRLKEGDLRISCTFLGFESASKEVVIRPGETTTLDFELDAKYQQIDEVVVSIQAYGQTKAINQQINSDAFVNVLSEEKIKELPDVNLAEAIGRLPGIALQRSSGEGQKVIIRGLEPNFATITVNGMKLASTESGDRSSNLSLISSDMLSSVEVIKSPTPDMDADAIAGTVNLGVRKASSKPILRLKLTNVYNAFRNDPLNYQASVIAGRRFFDNKLGVVVEANSENLNRGLDYESSNMDSYLPEEEKPYIWTSYNKERRFEERDRYGASLNVDYSLKNGDIFFNGMYSKNQSDILNTSNSMYVDFLRMAYSATFREVEKKTWNTTVSGNHKILNLSLDWAMAASQGKTDVPVNYTTDFELLNGVSPINQELRILEPVNWDTASNPNFLETRMEGYTKDRIRNSDEKIYSAYMNMQVPIIVSENVGGWFKTGVKYQMSKHNSIEDVWRSPMYRTSGFRINRFKDNYPDSLVLTSRGGVSMINFLDMQEDETDFLGGQTDFYFPVLEDRLRLAYDADRENFDHVPVDGLPQTYSAEESIIAGYAMFRMQFGSKLIFIPGVRYELMRGSYTSYVVDGTWDDYTAEQRSSSTSFPELLPHFHVKYEPLSWMDIRFAYNKTLSRPRYRHISPYGDINANNETIKSGNPNLKQAVSNNYDFNVSVYDGQFGLLAVGAFYKDIKNNVFNRSHFLLYNDSIADAYGYPGYVNYSLTRRENADSKVWGAEVELQANFNFLPYPANGLILSMNYSRLFSEMTVQSAIKFEEVVGWDPVKLVPISQTTVEETYRTIAMPDQTPHIFNTSIGYDFRGFSSRFSFIYQGLRIASVSNTGLDSYILDTYQLDLSLKQKFNKRFSIYVNLNNLFNLRKDTNYNYELYYKTREQQWGMNVFTGIIFNL